MNDILIKSASDNTYKGGYDEYHVMMGAGFIDALHNGMTLKEPIENESALENGSRIIVNKKKAKRTFNLTFNIHGSSKSEFLANKAKFEAMLYEGVVHMKINDPQYVEYYHLIYTGKSVTYKHSYKVTFGIFTAQFIEPDPTDRGVNQTRQVRVVG